MMMMMILGVSPLRGFPVERRGIGHLVPILCGRRLAGLVRLGGGNVLLELRRCIVENKLTYTNHDTENISV